MLNVKKLASDINEISTQLKNLKVEIRRPNRQIGSSEALAMNALKKDVTLLCMIRAAHRHKVHLSAKMTPQAQYDYICLYPENVKQYQLPAPVIVQPAETPAKNAEVAA
jgi:hypothetical protein